FSNAHLDFSPFPTRRSSDLSSASVWDLRSGRATPTVRAPGRLDASDRIETWRYCEYGSHCISHSSLASASLVSRCVARSLYRPRSEEHTSELQSPYDLVCRL